MCCGHLGWNPTEFWNATFRDVANASRGYRSKIEEREKSSWERIRWATACIVNMSGKTLPKGRSIKPIDLGRFPWESAPRPHVHGAQTMKAKGGETREERKARWDREMKEHYAKLNGTR